MTRLRTFLRRLFHGADVTTCRRCGGAGTKPAVPARGLLADRALLRRAVLRLEDWGQAGRPDVRDEARALRTLLERLDGAP